MEKLFGKAANAVAHAAGHSITFCSGYRKRGAKEAVATQSKESHEANEIAKARPTGRRGMTKGALHRLKGFGYLTSSVSVFLLAAVSWSSAQKSTLLTALLIAGGAMSIIGMFCRWLTYEIEKRKDDS